MHRMQAPIFPTQTGSMACAEETCLCCNSGDALYATVLQRFVIPINLKDRMGVKYTELHHALSYRRPAIYMRP